MSAEVFVMAVIVVALALVFDFSNGFHDSANIVATMISSRAISPESALILAAICEFIGAYFLGTAVAKMVGAGIVDPQLLRSSPAGIYVVIAALLAAISWNMLTWYFGVPSSSSHALIGGLLGAFVVGWGPSLVQWKNILLIVGVLIMSPLIGLLTCLIFTRISLFFLSRFSPAVNTHLKRMQIFSSIALALSHGTNDAQKTMGVITFSLVLLGLHDPASAGVPKWVIIACSAAIALGIATGGWRIIKTLGGGLYKIRPIHGFAAQTTSAFILYITALIGFPVSTTQVITSSVIGAGAAFRPKMVRWHVAQDMVIAWLITIPATACLSGIVCFLLLHLLGHR